MSEAAEEKPVMEHNTETRLVVKGFKSKWCVYNERYWVGQEFIGTIVANMTNTVHLPDAVWIMGFVKSGTNWLQEILYLMLNNCDTAKASTATLHDRTHIIERRLYADIEKSTERPRIIKTHLPIEMVPARVRKENKMIYIVRNPKDLVISYYHFMQLHKNEDYQGDLADFIGLFLDGLVPFGPWWYNVAGYVAEARHNKNLLIVHYEQLQRNNLETLATLAKFLDVDMDEEKLKLVSDWCSFDKMKKNPMANKEWNRSGEYKEGSSGSYMRKGKSGDWKNHKELFDSIAKAKFNGLTFDEVIAQKLGDNNPNIIYE